MIVSITGKIDNKEKVFDEVNSIVKEIHSKHSTDTKIVIEEKGTNVYAHILSKKEIDINEKTHSIQIVKEKITTPERYEVIQKYIFSD